MFGKSCVMKTTSKYNDDNLLGLTIENQVEGDIEQVAPRPSGTYLALEHCVASNTKRKMFIYFSQRYETQ